MKDLTFGTLLAVFEEIFGRGLFWAMVIAAALITLAYLYVLIRDRAVSWRKFLWLQLRRYRRPHRCDRPVGRGGGGRCGVGDLRLYR